MNFADIFSRTANALLFAACIGTAWMLLRLARLGLGMDVRAELKRLAMVVYIAALAEIVALRLGLPRGTQAVNLTPLESTVGALQRGFGTFIYHVVGNLIWFVPLGWLGRKLWPKLTVLQLTLIGAMVSVGLEATQWALRTGISDMDDVLLNALGAMLGAALARPKKTVDGGASSPATTTPTSFR